MIYNGIHVAKIMIPVRKESVERRFFSLVMYGVEGIKKWVLGVFFGLRKPFIYVVETILYKFSLILTQR